MAAVTASPPLPASSGPSQRKPLPLHALALSPNDRAEKVKPLPIIPISDSTRIRESPVSPVRVNFQPENWAQPSNVDIETTGSSAEVPRALNSLDRDLPKTPEAPTPPPHTPNVPTWHPGPTEKTSDLRVPGHKQTISSVGSEADKQSYSEQSSINRHSRESDAGSSTVQQQASTESSVTTSASSVSGILEASDSREPSGAGSSESSVVDDGTVQAEMVPQLHYHHAASLPRPASTMLLEQSTRGQSTPDLPEAAAQINRHLTATSQYIKRSSIVRPHSSYSVYSEFGARGRSPNMPGSHNRTSSGSRRSPDVRMSTYAELLNVPYPQQAPAPITFDNSQLRNAVGSNASLLSAQKTLEMYRQNVKKTNDPSIQYSFAVFLISTAQEQGLNLDEPKAPKTPKGSKEAAAALTQSSPIELVREARAILQKLANNGYPFAQYYLADGYASGLFSKGKEDYNSAFPLFVLAAKHGHAESAYRTALCYEFGWGCRKDPAKAVQFLRSAASKRHPGAMTRLGKACLSGDLGEKRYREAIKWLKLATESADTIYNAAPYHLGCLYETGYGDDIFMDESYAAELFTQAADLGHPEANFRMGDAYEHGRLNCPRDPALSVHFYTGAAERGHAAAMMGLCAWYMVGAEPILEKDEEEAYEWARRSADLGYVKAEYAVGYFTEMGIGCRRDVLEANVWYVKAADAGDERAKQRLAAIRAAVSGDSAIPAGPLRKGKVQKNGAAQKDDKECVVM